MENNSSDIKRVYWQLGLIIFGLIGVGTLGYIIIEGWSFLDALYMVVITLATVGYKEVHSLSPAGTVFTILLIAFGIVTLYYVARVIGEQVLVSRLDENAKLKKMHEKIQSLKRHYIVCGCGRVGARVVEELTKAGSLVVVIDIKPEAIEELRAKGYHAILGDATNEETLLMAGLPNAQCLISALGKDADNLMTVITARSLNSNIFIVAKANSDVMYHKLLRVGANRAVSPYQISGFRMANFALHTSASDFLDDAIDLGKSEVQITDVTIGLRSPLIGHPLNKYFSGHANSGVTVLVIHGSDGKTIINPDSHTELSAGDRLILMGTRDNLLSLHNIIK